MRRFGASGTQPVRRENRRLQGAQGAALNRSPAYVKRAALMLLLLVRLAASTQSGSAARCCRIAHGSSTLNEASQLATERESH
jgi:hypothetical protein